MSDNTPHANEETLRDLALRLASFPGDPRTDNPRLLIGQLPPTLPFELPLPDGSQILGTLIRGPEHIDIVADSSLSPGDALNFYKERMQAAGWQMLGPIMHPHFGGFVHAAMQQISSQLTFCQGTRGPSLTVHALAGKGIFTDLRLNVDTGTEYSPCAQQARMRRHPMGMENIIPTLMPPQGSRQNLQGGGGGGESWYSVAALDTGSDLTALSSHYSEQLVKAGWTRDDEGHDERIAWHTWTFEDEEHEQWRGLFFILKTPGEERRHFMLVRVELAGGGKNTWSGFGYAPMSRL